MKMKAGASSIVLVGHWNRHILVPKWVGDYVFDETKFTVEFNFESGVSQSFTAQSVPVKLMPSSNNVVFFAQDNVDKTLSAMEAFAIKLSTKLPETPVSGFGINIEYIEEAPTGVTADVFDLKDDPLLEECECQATRTSLIRKLIVQNKILNLNITEEKGAVTFAFNFHYEVKTTSEISDKIKGEVHKNKAIAEDMLKKIYNLSVEAEDGG